MAVFHECATIPQTQNRRSRHPRVSDSLRSLPELSPIKGEGELDGVDAYFEYGRDLILSRKGDTY
jgi:hypothetical protein